MADGWIETTFVEAARSEGLTAESRRTPGGAGNPGNLCAFGVPAVNTPNPIY